MTLSGLLRASRLSLAEQIDLACDAFEERWRRPTGDLPTIESALRGFSREFRASAFAELLAVELELRRRAGERPEPIEYAMRFPEFVPVIAGTFAAK
jgi:hypothetical protein